MRLHNITVGSDPELFIINTKTNKVVSAIGMIPGEKGKPFCAEDMPKGFGMETDNILAEFNIPPVKTETAFINNILYMQEYISKYVKNINPDLGIECAASKIVDKDQLQNPQAQQFGCDVDYNAYTESPNPKPKGNRTNLRSAGFHIHLGYDNPNIDTSLMLVKYMDMYLGIPSVLKDSDTKRRTLYGKAGSFRLTSYGVEYRVLSSYMMKDSELLKFVWKQLCTVTYAISSGVPLIDPELVVKAINESNVALATELVNSRNLM